MIICIIGKRTVAFQKALDKAVGGASDIERKNVTSENIFQIMDEMQTPSLFGTKKVFILSGFADDEDAKKIFFEQGASLADGPHDAIILAESFLAADVKKIEKFATVQKILDKESIVKKEAFNPFVLGNAFASGDKKQAWIAFSQVAEHGDDMEPTHGLVWWKLKDMMMKRSVFSVDQLKNMARDLVAVYHESRLGGLGMRERLEKFFLTMPTLK